MEYRPGLEPRENEPAAPLDFDEKALPASVKAELRGIPADTAHIIEGHLVAAAELLDVDPVQANAHAQAARRRAARLPVLREVAAETAYQAGEYGSALNDYRALRRMTGNDNYLPVMADCERALGRPQAALRLIREAEAANLSPSQRIELVLVQAGARRDMGQDAESVRLLRDAVKNLDAPTEALARLHYAYAEVLLERGDNDGARRWFLSAQTHDPADFLDTQDRIDLIDGREPEPEWEDDGIVAIEEYEESEESEESEDAGVSRGEDASDPESAGECGTEDREGSEPMDLSPTTETGPGTATSTDTEAAPDPASDARPDDPSPTTEEVSE